MGKRNFIGVPYATDETPVVLEKTGMENNVPLSRNTKPTSPHVKNPSVAKTVLQRDMVTSGGNPTVDETTDDEASPYRCLDEGRNEKRLSKTMVDEHEAGFAKQRPGQNLDGAVARTAQAAWRPAARAWQHAPAARAAVHGPVGYVKWI